MALADIYASAMMRAANTMGSPGVGTILGIILSDNQTDKPAPSRNKKPTGPGSGTGFG